MTNVQVKGKEKTKKIILCDLDDTLIQTQKAYTDVTTNTIKLIASNLEGKVNLDEIESRFHVLDIENMKRYPMAVRYPKTFVEVYREFATQKLVEIREDVEEKIYLMGASIFTTEIGYYDGAKEFVDTVINGGGNIVILTMGDDAIQRKRIEDIQLTNVVSGIEVVPEKKDAVMQQYVDKYGKDNVIMLGNSLSSDIRPALKVGIKGVHFERETWAYDRYNIDTTDENYVEVHSFDDMLHVLKEQGYVK